MNEQPIVRDDFLIKTKINTITISVIINTTNKGFEVNNKKNLIKNLLNKIQLLFVSTVAFPAGIKTLKSNKEERVFVEKAFNMQCYIDKTTLLHAAFFL